MLLVVSSSDCSSAFGRFDPALMDDQTRMELLVAEIENTASLKDVYRDFLDIKQWPNIIFDESDELQKIDFSPQYGLDNFFDRQASDYVIGPGGTVHIEWLPQTVKSVDLCELNLAGTVATESLPLALSFLNLNTNRLSGTFNMATLPPSLERLFIAYNAFEGEFDLRHLPQKIVDVNARGNFFSGSLFFDSLPDSIRSLSLAKNQFSGSIDLSKIPEALKHLDLKSTNISQETLVIPMNRDRVDRTLFFALDKSCFGEIVSEDGIDISRMISWW